MNVLFVCTGNTCRSPMCEGYFRCLAEKSGNSGWLRCASAGICTSGGMPASRNSTEVMKKYGVDLSEHESSPLTAELAEEAGLIVAMTVSHKLHIGAFQHDALQKTRLLLDYVHRHDADVADPYGGSERVYDTCFAQMKPALENLFLELVSAHAKNIQTGKE